MTDYTIRNSKETNSMFEETDMGKLDAHIKDSDVHVNPQEKEYWNGKAEKVLATPNSDGLFSSADKIKLSEIEIGAERNQNAFSQIKVGETVIRADESEEELVLEAGANLAIIGDNLGKKVTLRVDSTGLEADTLDGKHAGAALLTEEKNDLAAAVNELKTGKQDCLTVDYELSPFSKNPVQNYVITAALAEKAAAGHTHSYAGSSSAGGAATRAEQDYAGRQIDATYIRDIFATGKTITCTKGNGETHTFTTQDTVYIHPEDSGNRHIPGGGSAGQILCWDKDGTAVWGENEKISYSSFEGASAAQGGSTGLVPAPAAGEQEKFLKADGTWEAPADTNTWRGIQNNLTSESTSDSLSAAQGKVLNDRLQQLDTAATAHKSSDDHDGRYYTEAEIDGKLGDINTKVESCLKSVGDGKTAVASAITAQGVNTATDAEFSVMAANIGVAAETKYKEGAASARKGTAGTAQVLGGYTFTNASASDQAGAMPNRGALNWAPAGSASHTVPAGYYSGGTLNSSAAYKAGAGSAKVGNASASQVLAGKTFTTASGVGITGTMSNRGAVSKTFTPGASEQSYTIPKGYHDGKGKVTCKAVGSSYSNVKSGSVNITAKKESSWQAFTVNTGLKSVSKFCCTGHNTAFNSVNGFPVDTWTASGGTVTVRGYLINGQTYKVDWLAAGKA